MKATSRAAGIVDVFDCLIAITAPDFSSFGIDEWIKPLCNRFGDRRAHFR